MRLVCLLVCLSVCVAAVAREPQARRLFEQWKSADADGDGRLSRAEAKAMPRLARRFDAIDRNSDGFITPEEVRASRSGSGKRPQAAGGALAEVFARADANRDGAMDRREAAASLPRVARNFDRVDADRDGRITRAELDAWISRRKGAVK